MSYTLKLMQQLEEAHGQSKELMAKLSKSMQLQEFCPDAFNSGKCSTQVRGVVSRDRVKTAQFIITQADGTEHVYPLLDVPYTLWPKEALLEYTKYNIRKRKEFKEQGLL